MRWLRALVPLLGSAVAAFAAMADQPAASTSQPEHLRIGGLDLIRCEIGAMQKMGIPNAVAFCTKFDVPENWDEPSGRHIALRVAVVRARATTPDPDIVAFLDGGPGQAATEDYPQVAGALAGVRRRHHLLLVDQRGTGGSNPLRCPEEDAPDSSAMRAAPGPEQMLAQARRCLASLAPVARVEFYATTDAVRDLEAVRLALGGPQLDLIGVSYGTRLAQQYAMRHPAAVRSIVLDSPVPNRLALLSEHAASLEEAVRSSFAQCPRQPGCAEHFGDPYRSLYELRDRLRRDAPWVEMRDPQSDAPQRHRLGPGDLARLVRLYSYSPLTRALLPYLIDQAKQGRYAPLLANARLLLDDLTERMSPVLSASVVCTEDADLLHENPGDASTLLGTEFTTWARVTCPVWPHRGRPADFHEPLRGTVPLLVFSGEFDPVTPARYGAEIVRELSRARHFVLAGQGHAVLATGCVPRLLSDFVDRPEPARIDADCLKELGPVPFFLDASGAAP